MNRILAFAMMLLLLNAACGTSKQFGSVDDDVYYSNKANKSNVVLIKEVDVDSIIRANPPQYSDPRPTNSIEQVTPNSNAAVGYPVYRAQQDSLYQLHPELSGYYDPNPMPPFDQREADREARRAARLSNSYYTSYNYNPFWNNITIGYGYNNWYNSPYNNNNWGWNVGFGNNNWNNPYYNNWYGNYGWNNWGCNTWYNPYSYYGGWNSPYYGWNNPYYNNPYYGGWYGGGYYSNNSEPKKSTPPINRPRESMGGNAPPANAGVNTATPSGTDMRSIGNAPASNAPVNTSARLENVNGRVVYVPAGTQRSTPPPAYNSYQKSVEQRNVTNEVNDRYRPETAAPNNNTNTNTQPNRQERTMPAPNNNRMQQPNNNTSPTPTPAPTYQAPQSAPRYSSPPAGNNSGGGRSVGGSSGGNSGGRMSRPR